MKILVNATANNSRGPLSLTKNFLLDMKENQKFLKHNNIFLHVLVSKRELVDFSTKNVEIIYNGTPKKSFFHKYYFEHLFLPKYLNENDFDWYLSLQNTSIKKGDYYQCALVHTSLPFETLSFKDIEIKNYLKYKLLLRNMLKLQKNNMNIVIVQTKWIKEELEKLSFHQTIKVLRPNSNDIKTLDKKISKELEAKIIEGSNIKLFYPTNIEKYKNNNTLIKAVENFNKINKDSKVTLYLTLDGQDKRGVKYIGRVPYESIYNIYKSMDALIFPSMTETLGLPLLEAKQCNLPILVSDRKYSREVCDESAYYFDPTSVESIVSK
ncbi:glycosyltransferase, partial [Neobacillus niacini]|uniref:glycosyltransferase n=1 Tax=Neobacillus niacini TaxID=86668 RepID=UPI002FFE05E4